jgi:hypothetical protein
LTAIHGGPPCVMPGFSPLAPLGGGIAGNASAGR